MKLIITMVLALSMVPAAVSAFELQGIGAAGVTAMTQAGDIRVPAAPESSEAWKSLPSGGDAAAIHQIPTSIFAEGANAELRASLRVNMKPGASPTADAIVEVRGIGLGDIPPDYSVKSIAVYEGDTGRLVAAAENHKLVSNIFSWGKRVQTYSLEILKKDLAPAKNYVFAAEVSINGSYYWPVRSGLTAVQVANKFERGHTACPQDDNSGFADQLGLSAGKAAPMGPRASLMSFVSIVRGAEPPGIVLTTPLEENYSFDNRGGNADGVLADFRDLRLSGGVLVEKAGENARLGLVARLRLEGPEGETTFWDHRVEIEKTAAGLAGIGRADLKKQN